MIISIREHFLNKQKSEKTNDFKTSLEGISGKELYDTFSDQKTKYKDFIENVNNEN